MHATETFPFSSPRLSSSDDYVGSISRPLPVVVRTGIDADASLDRKFKSVRRTVPRKMWQTLIDQKLLVWLRDPKLLEDEGMNAPTETIVRLALDTAEGFRDGGLPPPDSIVADANGGIVFARREGEFSEAVHIWDDGTVEYQCFQGTRLVGRGAIKY